MIPFKKAREIRGHRVFAKPRGVTRGYATLAVSIFSGVITFKGWKMEATIKRKINTKQLTAVKPTRNNGRPVFCFHYYCPDLPKDNIRKFANTEAEAKVLREQIKIETGIGSNCASIGKYLFRRSLRSMDCRSGKRNAPKNAPIR